VTAGERLTEDEAGRAMAVIMEGQATPAQIGGLLTALAVRGESLDEIVGFARTMRERAVPLRSEGALDTCGTGGDGAGTFNISTIASLVAAACGVPVAKHGNRSSSGRCGSADVRVALGVKIDPPPETVQRCLDETGWTFLFAPSFHAATRHAVGPRRELGVRTAFNLLGPLTNPARPEAQLVGVPRPELAELMAGALQRLGVSRGWVVHGTGLDEVSLCGETRVTAFGEAGLEQLQVAPEDAGLVRAELDALRCSDAAHGAAIATEVLSGEPGPRRDAVVLNAAAALTAAGKAYDIRDGAARAAQVIDEGTAATLLERARRELAS